MGDGSTYRAHLRAMEDATGQLAAELHGAPPPRDAEHVWAWFLALHRARGGNGWGPNPISYQEIAAWSALTNTIIRTSEVDAIMALDAAWMSAQAKANAKPKAGDKPPQSPSRTRTTRVRR